MATAITAARRAAGITIAALTVKLPACLFQDADAAGEVRATKRLALDSLILGLLSLVVVLTGLPAVARGVRAIRQDPTGEEEAFAWVGIATGLLGTALGVSLLFFAGDWALEWSAKRDRGLKRVALALIEHYEDKDRLPPAVVYGRDGRSLHSWRVLVLPYLGYEDFYHEFRLDEPWDSPHNLALLPRMPAEDAPPRRKASKAPPSHTFCRVFFGKRALFDGREGRSLATIPDGRANTFLLAEAGGPVPWTKPEDIPYDPVGALPDLRGLFKDGFRAVSAGGDLVFVKYEVTEKVIRRAIQWDDGDLGDRDW